MIKALLPALIGAIAFAGAASAGVYKWVDKDGKVRYGDRPPPSEAGTVQEVNRSAVPPALQERLRKLDTDFRIKRISGNINVAAVCLQSGRNERGEPQFVREFATSKLGEIRKVGDVGYGYATEYDENGNPLGREKKVDDRCPDNRNDRTGQTTFQIWQITFDPKAVNAYRTQ